MHTSLDTAGPVFRSYLNLSDEEQKYLNLRKEIIDKENILSLSKTVIMQSLKPNSYCLRFSESQVDLFAIPRIVMSVKQASTPYTNITRHYTFSLEKIGSYEEFQKMKNDVFRKILSSEF